MERMGVDRAAKRVCLRQPTPVGGLRYRWEDGVAEDLKGLNVL